MSKLLIITDCDECCFFGHYRAADGVDYVHCFNAGRSFETDGIPEWCPMPDDCDDLRDEIDVAVEILHNFENDDGSVPDPIWKMRNDFIARNGRRNVEATI